MRSTYKCCQRHHRPIVLLSPPSVLTLHSCCWVSLYLSCCVPFSDDCSNDYVNARKPLRLVCAYRLHFLLRQPNSSPLPSPVSSPLCSSSHLPYDLSLPSFSAAAHLQTILEEDLEDPVYQVTFLTNHIASVNLLHFLSVSLLLSVCTVGRQPLCGYSVGTAQRDAVWRLRRPQACRWSHREYGMGL